MHLGEYEYQFMPAVIILEHYFKMPLLNPSLTPQPERPLPYTLSHHQGGCMKGLCSGYKRSSLESPWPKRL